MSEIDYKVPRLIRPVVQPDPRTCWAAAATVMLSWRHQASFSITAALQRVPGSWLRYFQTQSEGLDPALLSTFAEACGMDHEPLQCYTPNGWLELLEWYGPLAVVTQPLTYHVRVVWGMKGTLDRAGLNLVVRVIDPAGGRFTQEAFPRFALSVTHAARIPAAQVWHWP
jgi:hypothetical protein